MLPSYKRKQKMWKIKTADIITEPYKCYCAITSFVKTIKNQNANKYN